MGNYSKFVLAPNQRPRKMSHKYRALLKQRERIEATRWIHAKKGGTK